MAKVIKAFQGVPDGEIYPKEFAEGDECPPELEDAAKELFALEGFEKKPGKADK
jgi:hypothetical protein